MKRVVWLFGLLMLCLTLCASAETFDDFAQACSYVRSEAARQNEKIEFTVTARAVHGLAWSEIRDTLTDVLEYCESYTIAYQNVTGGKLITINAVARPSLRMLDAWETGDWSALTEDETRCLTEALRAAEACRANAKSAVEVELAVYDYICERVTYANEAVERGSGTPEYLRASTAVGALTDGLAQCQGYAEAFYLVGQLAGLDVETQYGWGGEGSPGKHAWNVVRIGQACYIVDVCWGDTGADLFELTASDYRYFNVGLDRMPADRSWHPEAEIMPVSAATNPMHTAFAARHGWGTTCENLSDALDYAIARHDAGEDYAHVLLPGQVTLEQVDPAMWQKIREAGISTVWGRMTYGFAGGTYLIIRWVLE